jgi:hypothetical protein
LQRPLAQYCDAGHTLPHAPQFCASFAAMQLEPQYTPLAHSHFPLQCSPSAQVLPQVPQLSRSLLRSAQSSPHAVMLAPLQPQAPLTHACPIGQLTPHSPQFCSSIARFTQLPSHVLCPAGQAHLPATQL